MNLGGLHTSSASWGDDPLEWLPSRWITKDESGNDALAPMPQGAFLPWAAGPRVCPGKKFSQVEFVAVLACLLKEYRVEPVAQGGMSEGGAAERLMEEVRLSSFNFLLKVKNPGKIRIRCVRKRRVE
ncbi:cytochrome P450 [Candidatus Bathyarchaeota archaeon]|nr:cytochrome P450 [Candidatus Bathyarchaeota archaeon]